MTSTPPMIKSGNINKECDMENLKKVINLLCEFGNVAPAVASAESIVTKVVALAPVTNEVAALITADFSKMSNEYKMLTPVDKLVLIDYAKTKFDIADDKLEQKLEDGLSLAFELYGVITKIIKYAKEARQ